MLRTCCAHIYILKSTQDLLLAVRVQFPPWNHLFNPYYLDQTSISPIFKNSAPSVSRSNFHHETIHLSQRTYIIIYHHISTILQYYIIYILIIIIIFFVYYYLLFIIINIVIYTYYIPKVIPQNISQK